MQLKPHPAGGPFSLTIKGDNTLVIEDVLVGEVWVCSGQSNMAFALREHTEANHPKLRMFLVDKSTAALPSGELAGRWLVCSPETAAKFSAVGYYFGRDLLKATGRPVGMIHSSWGGTAAESWISLAALERDPAFEKDAKPARAFADGYPQALAEYPAVVAEFEATLARWFASGGKAHEEALKTWQSRTGRHWPRGNRRPQSRCLTRRNPSLPPHPTEPREPARRCSMGT